jgi:peroxiredoxin family protein
MGNVPRVMTLNIFRTVLGKIPKSVCIDFSGFSEPWLNQECTEMVLYANDLGYEVSVFTTAVGMNISDFEKIKAISFKRFCLHLPDIEGYAKIKLDNNYLKTLDAIINGNVRNFDLMTMGTLPKQIRKMIGKRISPTKMVSRAGNLRSQNGIKNPSRLTGVIRCRSCGDLFNHNVLLPNGDVVVCCYDFGLQHILGNLIKSDYNSLFTGETFQELQKGLNDDSVELLCRYCENASSVDEYERLNRKEVTNKKYFLDIISSLFRGIYRN